jgi:hypothetical protein
MARGHEATATTTSAGKPNLRKANRFFAVTNRLRSEGIDYPLAAAEATGVSHVVAQATIVEASLKWSRSRGAPGPPVAIEASFRRLRPSPVRRPSSPPPGSIL